MTSDDSAVQRLQSENDRLRQQVKRLMAGESKLYQLQGHLSAQQRVYVKLSELARNLNTYRDIEKILGAVVEFALYGFNYERCVAFLEEPGSETEYRVAAHDGYYEEEERQALEQLVLTGHEAALEGVLDEAGFACHPRGERNEAGAALGGLVMLDEYFVFALPRKAGRPLGFLMAGNTGSQARYQTEVEAEGEMLVAFSNLASQTATAINQVRSYRALERERELLDQMVAERTRELSEALDTAHEAVRVKAEFLAKVSHELRTPLNSIVNVPTALLDDYADVELYVCGSCGGEFRSDKGERSDEPCPAHEPCPDCGARLEYERRFVCVGDAAEHARFLGLLQEQGKHLLSIVEDVLDVSRLESGRVELTITEVGVERLFGEIEATFTSANRGADRSITYHMDDRSLTLLVDRVKLKQILINLIGNAIKFTEPGGHIRVDVRREAQGLVFSVADDGIGIPEDQLEFIFESFRQVDGSHTRAFGGVGLGLAISRQLTEMHGGNISVSSVKGEGSTFRVWLPEDQEVGVSSAHPEGSEAPGATGPSARRLGYGTAVVVDDEPAQLSMARKLLEREGYDTVLVSNARDVLETVRRVRPRFILLDIMMPDINGLTVLSQLAREDELRSIPVFVSTAYHYNKQRVASLGGLWLPKPWSSRTLSAQNLESWIGDSTPTNGGAQARTRLGQSVSSILYVEDEDANWEVTQLSLRGKYELVRARNSREVFEQLAKRDFDLILMDIQLAGSDLNGIEVTEVLSGKRTENVPNYAKEVGTEAPIVFVTAYSSLYSRQDLLDSGAQELISKPVDFAHLLMVISRLMVQGRLSEAQQA